MHKTRWFFDSRPNKNSPGQSGAINDVCQSSLFPPELVGNGQLVATLAATAGEDFAAVGGLHALAETVNGFTTATMRLECTFHDFLLFHVAIMRTGRTVRDAVHPPVTTQEDL